MVISEAITSSCPWKAARKTFRNIRNKTSAIEFFLVYFIRFYCKKEHRRFLSVNFFPIFQNSYFMQHLWKTASATWSSTSEFAK